MRCLIQFFFLSIATLCFACQRIDYPVGRDTVKVFGKGKFQIIKTNRDLTLFDLENGRDIISEISDWKQKDESVFLVNKQGVYLYLNYGEAKYNTYQKLEDAPDTYKEEFRKLEIK